MNLTALSLIRDIRLGSGENDGDIAQNGCILESPASLKAINTRGAKVEVVDGVGAEDGIKAAANYLTIDGFEIYDTAPGIGHHGNGILYGVFSIAGH